MKASKFTEAQIAFVLKQAADGSPVGEVCRKAGISDATFYNWRKKYAGLMPSRPRAAAAPRCCINPGCLAIMVPATSRANWRNISRLGR